MPFDSSLLGVVAVQSHGGGAGGRAGQAPGTGHKQVRAQALDVSLSGFSFGSSASDFLKRGAY